MNREYFQNLVVSDKTKFTEMYRQEKKTGGDIYRLMDEVWQAFLEENDKKEDKEIKQEVAELLEKYNIKRAAMRRLYPDERELKIQAEVERLKAKTEKERLDILRRLKMSR